MFGKQMRARELPDAEGYATFERVLEQGLHSQQITDTLGRPGGTLDRGQLRTRALQARDDIAAAAAVEYRRYVEAWSGVAAKTGDSSANGVSKPGALSAGGGLLPVLAVLIPTLAAAAAITCLIIGFTLLTLGGRPYIGNGLITAGLIAGAVAVGGAVGDLGYLIVAAVRNGSADLAEGPEGTASDVTCAREEWELALLERGVLPFLLGRIEENLAGNGDNPPDRRSGSGPV
ncbi:hypothetical protein ACFV2N_36670 [Streptomyces sp. NPDC059680]|uniref:hypothetical protein n=1 Tax=Streptomyces sp. NPDC059680 TaxID=3346904 RepID=UPI0036BA7326